MSSTSTGASDSMPSTAIPWASLSVISAAAGGPGRAGRRGSYLVGEEQLAARRRPEAFDGLEGALVGDREACGSRRPRRRRTPPAGGAPRSVGRRRRCRRARRTRRASRRGRRGSTPRPTSRRTTSSSSTSWPGGELDRLEVGQPLDLRLEHRADGRDDDLERAVVRLGAGVLDPAQDSEPATDRVAARAQPLVRQRLPGRVERDRHGSSRSSSSSVRSSASRTVAATTSTVRPASTRP